MEPLLGIFDNYGGPLRTVPPLLGSPAIDAGPTNNVPRLDARGQTRPGSRSDIGAFEQAFGRIAFLGSGEGVAVLSFFGEPAQRYAVEKTTDFKVSSAVAGADNFTGWMRFERNLIDKFEAYRVRGVGP